jgi:hypothetical protein
VGKVTGRERVWWRAHHSIPHPDNYAPLPTPRFLDEQRAWHDEARRIRDLAIYDEPDGLPSRSTELIF